MRLERVRQAAPAWPLPPAAVQARATSPGASLAPVLLLVLLALSCSVRLFFLQRAYMTPDADQTIIGLMARHIQAGERPVFYWGQPYTGSGDAFISAALFTVFGQHDILLHLAPLVASLLWVALTFVLAWRLYGPGVAALCGLFLALPPSFLIDWSVWAGSGYLETMALGTAALLLTLPPRSGPATAPWMRLPVAFLLLGIALWVQPIAAYYVLAVVAQLLGRMIAALRVPAHRPPGMLLAGVCALAFAAGMAPLLQFNLQHDWATLSFLTNRSAALGTATVFSRGLLWAGPVLLGLAPASTDGTYFSRFLLDHLALYGLALAALLLLLVRALALWRSVLARLRTVLTRRPAPDLGLIVLLIALLVGYLTSSWGAERWSGSQPRYLLPIYTTLPLIVRAALPRHIALWHWVAAVGLMAGLCAGNLYINSTVYGRADVQPPATLLKARGIAAVYGDYWVVVPLTYRSDERVIGVAVRDDLGNEHNNRYSPYVRAAAATRNYAWVVQAGSVRQRNVIACLSRLHSRFTIFTWRDQVVYEQPTGRAFPWWNGGRCPTFSNNP